jgi:hypothetical protein
MSDNVKKFIAIAWLILVLIFIVTLTIAAIYDFYKTNPSSFWLAVKSLVFTLAIMFGTFLTVLAGDTIFNEK